MILKRRPIKPSDYETILASDIDVYPTETPLTAETFSIWYARHPEFGIIYYYDSNELVEGIEYEKEVIVGTCCVVPLTSQGWSKFTNGLLLESELDSEVLFDNSQHSDSGEDEIGLHIYHMERYPSWTSLKNKEENSERLGDLVLKSIQEILEELRITNTNLKVVGLSGLCVSTSGINLFSNYYNCRERSYISNEHILREPRQLNILSSHAHSNGGILVLETNQQSELQQFLDRGYHYITRCKMLVLKPEDCSVVWRYIRA
ncbi:hypothetical protein K7432_009297 [Basidiobolus ranarum]|uniref:Uncharacterized protein n=1 Tax=Basidiobolus ranarum TaxID=34480 RepID=A0ABR2VXA6_9FUNG